MGYRKTQKKWNPSLTSSSLESTNKARNVNLKTYCNIILSRVERLGVVSGRGI